MQQLFSVSSGTVYPQVRLAVHVEPVLLDQWDKLVHLDLGNFHVFLQDKRTRAGLLTWQMNP